MTSDPRTRRYAEAGEAAREVELPRGDVTEGVVRVGGTDLEAALRD